MNGGYKVLFMASLLVLLSVATASAAGFGIYEWSARGNAMGGAVMATPKDAATIATNPAGMTDVPGNSMVVGVSAINPEAHMEFSDPEYRDATAKSNVWMPPHAYLTSQLNDNWWLGIGAFSRFGLGTEWDENWAGRYNVTEASIETLSFNPNLAYKINDQFSVAVGAEVMWFQFLQRKTVDHGLGFVAAAGGLNNPNTFVTDTDAKLLGDSTGIGLTLSAYHKPLDWLSVALTYRSQVQQKLQGDVWFRRQGTEPALFAGTYDTNTEAEGKIILPDSVSFGVAVKPMDKLTLEGDVIWTRWSTYQELRIDYKSRLVAISAASDHSASVKNWHDTFRYQLGAEYALNDTVDLRAGYIFDQSPISADHADYMLPTADRDLYSTGVGLHWDNWTVDLSYIYLVSDERSFTAHSGGILDGHTKDTITHIGGISLGYAF